MEDDSAQGYTESESEAYTEAYSSDTDNADEEVLAPSGREWKSATFATVDHTRDCVNQVKEAVRVLEQQEADRVAAIKAERKRQRLLAEAAEKQRREAIEAEREKNYKRLQAEELARQQNLVRQRKQAESAAIRAATANFKRMTKAEKDAKEKERVKENLKDTSTRLLENVLECQHLRSKLWGALKLCEKRRTIRESRPPAEKFPDDVDQALEHELQTLTVSRDGLKALAKRGNDVRGEMQAVYTQLNFKQSREKSTCRMVRPSSAPSLLPALDQEPPQNDGVLQEAIAFTVEATGLAKQTANARKQISTQCDRAAAMVNSSLDRRKADLGELIEKLLQQKSDAEKTIADAERRVQRLKDRFWHSSLGGDAHAAKEEQLISAENLIHSLGSLKNTLARDLSNKYQALKIDESCRLFTKTTAGGPANKNVRQSVPKPAKDTLALCDEENEPSMAPAG